MTFYDTLRNMRKAKGFTIREVAERSGVSPSYISQLENGQRGLPSPDVLHKLAGGLHSSYRELMRAAGYWGDGEPAEGEGSEQRAYELRSLLRELDLTLDGQPVTPEDKEWIDRMLTALYWKERKQD